MRTEADKQARFEHYILNHLPKDFTFYEDYGCYPVVFVDVNDTKGAKELIEKEFLKAHFSTKMVEVNIYEDDDYKQVELVFDLLLFTEEKMKECLQLAYNTLVNAKLIGKNEKQFIELVNAAEIKKMKFNYEAALEQFLPLRYAEMERELTELERQEYIMLLEDGLLPLQEILYELGEEEFLDQYETSYEY